MDNVDYTHPIDLIEPLEYENAYAQAAVFFFGLLESSIAHIMASDKTRVGLAQIKVALGLSDESMSEIAARLGVTPQCISKGAKAFIAENNLPIPRGMEGEESSEAHRKARNKQLKNK